MVDMDLEKFFDRVNQDKLLALLAQRIGDKDTCNNNSGIMPPNVCPLSRRAVDGV